MTQLPEFTGGEGACAPLDWTHGYVYVFENFARGDSPHAIGGLDQVVSLLTAMLSSESVDKEKRFGELFSFDQKTRAIHLPVDCRCFHDAHHPLGGGKEVADLRIYDCWLSCQATPPNQSEA
jgi:hypothetical protein